MEACIRDVRMWMIFDKEKIKVKNTEFILIDFRAHLKKVEIDNIAVRDSHIYQQGCNQKLGSWFESNLMMNTHVTKTCKAGYFYIHNIINDRHTTTCRVVEWSATKLASHT